MHVSSKKHSSPFRRPWFSGLPGIRLPLLALAALSILVIPQPVLATTCSGTDITWKGGTGGTGVNWSKNTNWVQGIIPNSTAYNAVIVSGSKVPSSNSSVTINCFEADSGTMNTSNGVTLTIAGTYFQNLNLNTISVASGGTWTVKMAGTSAQTFSNVDTMNYITIANNTSVTFDHPFTLRNTLSMTGTGTTLYLTGNLTLSNTAAPLTIPSTDTVDVGSGVTLTALGGITVNGTLTLHSGASLILGSGTTLQVNAGGALVVSGTTGNVATIDGNANATYNINIAGSLTASFMRVNHPTTAGINVTGTINSLSDSEIHNIANTGAAITLGAAASIPTTMNNMSFFNDDGNATVTNINASAYNVSATTLNNWSGIGGATYENDPNNLINWGAQAGTQLTLSNDTAAGNPPSTVNAGTGPTYFATFAFNLNQSSAATDITSVTITNNGTATAADIDYIQVFSDANANCIYDAGTDTQIGSNLTLSGSPATATVSIPAGTVTTNGSSAACIHVLVHVSAAAVNGNTISMEIASSSDVTNSQGYTFSGTSGPPVSAGSSSIVGSSISTWDGSSTSVWTRAANWTPATVPSATRDCKVGAGVRYPIMSVNGTCQNMTLLTGGTVDFNNTTFQLAATGSLNVQSGYTFLNAATGVLAMSGSTNQSLTVSTAFPGNLTVANTGNATVSVSGNSTINGNVTVSQGTLEIPNGVTLTVGGNISVASGATLQIDPGGTLALGNGSIVTINSGGTLQMVGTSSLTALMTSTATTNAYTVVVNGTISAQYYTFSQMGTAGITIGSGATINATNHLQNGNFTYPVNNGTTMLTLDLQVPTNTMNNMSFDAAGSGATGVTNIATSAAAGTLTITTYTGSWAGPSYSNAPVYLIAWAGATNSINVTANASAPASVNQGTTYVMGSWGFAQTTAGASYVDTDITSLKVTMVGTGSAADVSQVRIYYSSTCATSGGTLLGTGTFSGNPATVTFSGISGATVQASTTSPPTRCIYVEYDISSSATNADTVGAEIQASGDEVNSQNYGISGSTPAPISLGTATVIGSSTTWTGAAGTTNWFTAGNWNGGVPTSSLNCIINNAANLPTIGSGTGTCKSITINSGTLTMAAGTTLNLYGSFTDNGTFNQGTGTLEFSDTGSSSNQTISEASGSLGTVTFNKTLGGTVQVSGTSLTINTLTIPAGSNFEFQVPSGTTLTLTNGLTIPAGTFTVEQGGVLALPNGKGITVNGGTFKTSGTNDAYPQSTANKAKVTVSGSGSWFFSATSGTVDLTGFILDYIDTNGLNLSGTTTLANLNGGQFTDLSTTYASVKAIQLNNTGSIPALASNVGWNWGPNNTPPSSSTSYDLAASTGCASQSITFDQWFGDFYTDVNNPDPSTKVSSTNCTITIATSASPVSMLSLNATPYDSSVDVTWTTTSEVDHQGFNVYRSDNPSAGFVQINSELIRNTYTSSSQQGKYRFVDTGLTNGNRYYYYVEDVAFNGDRTRHGPVSAVPAAGLGTPPPTPPGTNDGTTQAGGSAGNGPGSGTSLNTDFVDLGNGVHLVSQTANTMRIEVILPPVTLAPSSWDANYMTLSVPGYSPILTPGAPETLNRTLLIASPSQAGQVTVVDSNVTEAPVQTVKLAPAPRWSPDGSGQLIPSWQIDSTAYGINAFSPSNFFDVTPTVKTVSGQNFVQIDLHPFLYNPVTQQLRQISKIVLDLSLDGVAWTQPPSAKNAQLAPAAVEGTLRIRYQQEGIYELDYDDIAAAGLDGPFAGADTSQFRLYYDSNEIPLEVNSATGNFTSGDTLRFLAPHPRYIQDSEDEVVLSRWPLLGTATSPLRIQIRDGNPSGVPSSPDSLSWGFAQAEQDLMGLFSEPVGSGDDHLYWGQVLAQGGAGASSQTKLALALNLPSLDPNAADNVHLHVYVKGGRTEAYNLTHDLGLYINASPNMVASRAFNTQDPTQVEFSIPSSYFVPGLNTITATAVGDTVPNSYYDRIFIDRIEANYRADRLANNGVADVNNNYPNTSVVVSGLPAASQSLVYDVTDIDNLSRIGNFASDDVNGTITFATNTFGSDSLGYHYLVYSPGTFLKPSSLSLGQGYETSLYATTNGADLIVIGRSDLLSAANPLIERRRSEGLRVAPVALDQIFAEFSHGQKSTQAISDFITYARAHWMSPAPRYLLILGGASYDPMNRFGYGAQNPVALVKGLFEDFGSDENLVEDQSSGLPALSVGRLPTDDPAVIAGYVNKVLSYEDGTGAPLGTQARHGAFISDTDQMNEGFAKQTQTLSTALVASNPAMSVDQLNRPNYSSDGQLKTDIENLFANPPLVLTYVGHGAEDRWASADVLTAADAGQLSNQRYPFVLGLDCLNSYFYDPDPTYQSLAKNMVLNANGGSIGFWGSTTLTPPPVQVALAKTLFEQMALETGKVYHTVRVGDLMLRSKQALGMSPATADTLRSWTYFGDPTLKIPAASFSGVAPSPSSQTSPSNQDTGHGGCGLGSLSVVVNGDPKSGGDGTGGAGAASILALPILIVLGLRRFRTGARST